MFARLYETLSSSLSLEVIITIATEYASVAKKTSLGDALLEYDIINSTMSTNENMHNMEQAQICTSSPNTNTCTTETSVENVEYDVLKCNEYSLHHPRR